MNKFHCPKERNLTCSQKKFFVKSLTKNCPNEMKIKRGQLFKFFKSIEIKP